MLWENCSTSRVLRFAPDCDNRNESEKVGSATRCVTCANNVPNVIISISIINHQTRHVVIWPFFLGLGLPVSGVSRAVFLAAAEAGGMLSEVLRKVPADSGGTRKRVMLAWPNANLRRSSLLWKANPVCIVETVLLACASTG